MPSDGRRRAVLVAVIVLLAAIAGGCTQRQSQDQYEERLQDAVEARDQAVDQVTYGKLTDDTQYAEAIKRVRHASDELDADAPPKQLEAGHERMVAGMAGLARLLELLQRCDAHDTSEARLQCRSDIEPDVYDTIRNDFEEANTIYRQEGLSIADSGTSIGQGGGAGSAGAGEGDEL